MKEKKAKAERRNCMNEPDMFWKNHSQLSKQERYYKTSRFVLILIKYWIL